MTKKTGQLPRCPGDKYNHEWELQGVMPDGNQKIRVDLCLKCGIYRYRGRRGTAYGGHQHRKYERRGKY